jgi:hypothetical protein
MKKTILLSCLLASAVAFVAFAPKSSTNTMKSSKIEISSSDINTVDVCQFKRVGTSGTAKNCNFTGKYNTETNRIVIYKRGDEVASGTPRRNNPDSYDERDSRRYYTHYLNDYYFNL